MTLYGLITERSKGEFTRAVTDALADGWRLQGGVAVTRDIANGILYAQAIIKENLPEPRKL